jgi:hypothetical protein
VQVLDGISAAVLGVTIPLIVADIMRGTGRFNHYVTFQRGARLITEVPPERK